MDAVDARYPGRLQWPEKWLFDRSAGFLQAIAFDWVIDGDIVSFQPGQFDRHPTLAGQCDHLARGQMKGAAITDHYWAFEYGRGSIISMWPTTLFGALFTDCDLHNLFEMMHRVSRSDPQFPQTQAEAERLGRAHDQPDLDEVPGLNAKPGQGICNPLMLRAMTNRWISDVPSKIV